MRKRPLALAALGIGALAACEPAPFDPADPNRNRRQGAIAGGVAGAITGIATGDTNEERRERAVLGAAIGAGAGALVGNRLDRQAAELSGAFDNPSIGVINTGDQLIVRMPEGILFETESASVNPRLQSDLATLAGSLNRYPDTTVQVIGHTDNTGSAAFNQDLSERRAAAVASVLRANGVSGGRIQAFGAGEDQPIATNLTPEGRQQNRRVDIVITPTG